MYAGIGESDLSPIFRQLAEAVNNVSSPSLPERWRGTRPGTPSKEVCRGNRLIFLSVHAEKSVGLLRGSREGGGGGASRLPAAAALGRFVAQNFLRRTGFKPPVALCNRLSRDGKRRVISVEALTGPQISHQNSAGCKFLKYRSVRFFSTFYVSYRISLRDFPEQCARISAAAGGRRSTR